MSNRMRSRRCAISHWLAIAGLSLAPAMATGQHPGNSAALVESALSAAPASVASHATVIDHHQNVLRKGTNGWTCMPDDPEIPNNSPMCLDAPWLDFIGALMGKRAPKVTGLGIGYMLQGDMPVSNLDPAATSPSATNQWIQNGGPHIMLILPDTAAMATLSSDPHNGGPFVMWRGTPYAHVMIPTQGRQR